MKTEFVPLIYSPHPRSFSLFIHLPWSLQLAYRVGRFRCWRVSLLRETRRRSTSTRSSGIIYRNLALENSWDSAKLKRLLHSQSHRHCDGRVGLETIASKITCTQNAVFCRSAPVIVSSLYLSTPFLPQTGIARELLKTDAVMASITSSCNAGPHHIDR